MSEQKERLILPPGVPEDAKTVLEYFAEYFNRRLEAHDETRARVRDVVLNNLARLGGEDEAALREKIGFAEGRVAGQEAELLGMRDTLDMIALQYGGSLGTAETDNPIIDK